MRKFQKAAVVVAMLGSVGFLGAGVSYAGDHPDVELNNKQATACPQDNSAKGLIVIDDINLAVGILGLGVAENSETNSIECASSFAVGGE
ncbi:hypothetical protein ACWDMR_05555 [Streptomyces althioticus]|jgi:hypothetical protein|uniref:Secreted protein n=1 Tax=Streptomyces griseorubens TaxID=66897 RepID=A0ABR4T4F3_9ACTN|nr:MULTISPECIES: hypothetical protein [Actinomycetes]ALV50247.1 hypothetical protein ASR50_13100 [Streptomyces sp. 4F]MCC9686112.1 hypothetical protein [Streptomyces sp. MNU103]WTC25140.1 hypothetical protein OG872_21850 [Streptomyces althioticus]GGT77186.1 hypothetical protein GCM10010243_64850 [Streptomyces matensis]KEG42150.1 hypothetical protein DJ64_33885 [Streptomyces griseorubens]